MERIDVDLLRDLEPTAEKAVNTHLERAEEWMPFELVPWSKAEDFPPDYQWKPTEAQLPEEVRSALYVNLLTEDNLPHYTTTITRRLGYDGVWGFWGGRWTAEEQRHSEVIRDYLIATRSIDPHALEHARMQQVTGREVPQPPTTRELLAYVTLQELATQISHKNTGKHLDDDGKNIMDRVGADESKHYAFYYKVASAGFEIDPCGMVQAVERQVRNFAMPGTGIPGFKEHSRIIAKADIFSPQILHDSVLVPVVLNRWKVDKLEGLTPEAEQARERLIKRIQRIGNAGRRFAAEAEEETAKAKTP